LLMFYCNPLAFIFLLFNGAVSIETMQSR
jgi:hypothetical protein